MVQDIPLTIAFLAGILSFLSPCVLPIVPGFISYIVGKSFADLQNSSAANTLKLLPHILLFTLGFSFVFIIMGASIDFLSDIFFDFKKQLNFIILEQILHSNIFPILSPKFSKNHSFQIRQNRMKFYQKNQNSIKKSFKFDPILIVFLKF